MNINDTLFSLRYQVMRPAVTTMGACPKCTATRTRRSRPLTMTGVWCATPATPMQLWM